MITSAVVTYEFLDIHQKKRVTAVELPVTMWDFETGEPLWEQMIEAKITTNNYKMFGYHIPRETTAGEKLVKIIRVEPKDIATDISDLSFAFYIAEGTVKQYRYRVAKTSNDIMVPAVSSTVLKRVTDPTVQMVEPGYPKIVHKEGDLLYFKFSPETLVATRLGVGVSREGFVPNSENLRITLDMLKEDL